MSKITIEELELVAVEDNGIEAIFNHIIALEAQIDANVELVDAYKNGIDKYKSYTELLESQLSNLENKIFS